MTFVSCCNLFATVALFYQLSYKIDRMIATASMSPAELKTEEELVKRSQHDREAFGELYEIYYQRIFNFALKPHGQCATGAGCHVVYIP
jgi:hypothetical protein